MPSVYQQLSVFLLRFHLFTKPIDLFNHSRNAEDDVGTDGGQDGELRRQRRV